MELERRFATDEACREYLAQLRWPRDFSCTVCGATKAWATRRGLRMCATCGHQMSVTAGTIFQDTRIPLPTWFRAIWWVTNQKTGVSALGLQRALGLRSYKTAWAWLHKLRRAMVRPGRDRLTGWVEVDETFVGGVASRSARRDRQQTKALVASCGAGAMGRRLGRIRLQRLARRVWRQACCHFVAGRHRTRQPSCITDGCVGYDPAPASRLSQASNHVSRGPTAKPPRT